MRAALRLTGQAAAMVVASALVAVATNALRPDGIPLVTDVEYEIFAPCKDSEAQATAITRDDLSAGGAAGMLYVDARPKEAFDAEHVEGAQSVPYSVLFGASPEDLERLTRRLKEERPEAVVVYGILDDPSDPSLKVDLGKELAKQLVDTGIAGVKHLAGGLDELKKGGVATVKAAGAGQ